MPAGVLFTQRQIKEWLYDLISWLIGGAWRTRSRFLLGDRQSADEDEEEEKLGPGQECEDASETENGKGDGEGTDTAACAADARGGGSRQRALRMKGLRNRGNTCYLNSVLQALASVNSLRDYVESVQRAIDRELEEEREDQEERDRAQGRQPAQSAGTDGRVGGGMTWVGWLWTLAFGDSANAAAGMETVPLLIECFDALSFDPVGGDDATADEWDTAFFDPWKLQQHLHRRCRRLFSGNEQQDAQELLQVLMDALEVDVKRLRKRQRKRARRACARAQMEGNPQDQQEEVVYSQTTRVTPLTGLLASEITCRTCGQSRMTDGTPFVDMSLPIARPQRATTAHVGRPLLGSLDVSLNDCLERFMAGEDVDDVECETCSRRCRAHKQLLIAQMPRALCFHIARREYDPYGGCMLKNNAHVKFPLLLSMAAFVPAGNTSATAGTTYQLRAVVVHIGNGEEGHYATYRRGESTQWHFVSDERTRNVSSAEVLASQAYILMYEKCSAPGMIV